jgi:hypothetical protein
VLELQLAIKSYDVAYIFSVVTYVTQEEGVQGEVSKAAEIFTLSPTRNCCHPYFHSRCTGTLYQSQVNYQVSLDLEEFLPVVVWSVSLSVCRWKCHILELATKLRGGLVVRSILKGKY